MHPRIEGGGGTVRNKVATGVLRRMYGATLLAEFNLPFYTRRTRLQHSLAFHPAWEGD